MLFGIMIASAAIELSDEDLDTVAGGNIQDIEASTFSSEKKQVSSLFQSDLAGIISGTQTLDQQVNTFGFKNVSVGS